MMSIQNSNKCDEMLAWTGSRMEWEYLMGLEREWKLEWTIGNGRGEILKRHSRWHQTALIKNIQHAINQTQH